MGYQRKKHCLIDEGQDHESRDSSRIVPIMRRTAPERFFDNASDGEQRLCEWPGFGGRRQNIQRVHRMLPVRLPVFLGKKLSYCCSRLEVRQISRVIWSI